MRIAKTTRSISFEKLYPSLDRLARSCWGKQGVGRCPNKDHRYWLTGAGLARTVKGEKEDILALTLKGFRLRESIIWDKRIKKAGGLRHFRSAFAEAATENGDRG